MVDRNCHETLPVDVKNRILRGTYYSVEEREKLYDKFTKRFLNQNSLDPEEFGSVFLSLEKGADRKIIRKRRDIRNKKLSFRQRKELGLYTLGRKSIKYKDLLPLHHLWKDYMNKYMNFSDLNSWNNHHEDPNFEQVSLKLYRADYHGAKMTVIKSSCPSYVGKSGIVAMETKNCFKLVGSDDVVRTIPKGSCLFEFKLSGFQFTFFGKNLQARPAERSNKKIKTIYSSDLLL